MTEARPPLRPIRAFATVLTLLGTVALPAAAASSAPAAHPARKTTMMQTEGGGAFTEVQLKDLVAQRIGPWEQTGLDVPLESRAEPQPVTLIYAFRNGPSKATLKLVDGGVDSAAPGPSHWSGPPNRRETDAGKEYVYREGKHTVREIERRVPPAREVVLLLANGIVVTATGDADMPALKALATGVPLATAEALVRPSN